jgi:hypothetical protein
MLQTGMDAGCDISVSFCGAKLTALKRHECRFRAAQGEPKRYAFWFSEFGAKPQTPPEDVQEFREAKLRKIKTAERF